jgi:NAD dependent epimerase/dehydratase
MTHEGHTIMTDRASLAHRTVLVTGAAGFIGSHLVERLLDEAARVRVFLRYTSRSDMGSLRWLPPQRQAQLEVVFGDLRDQHAVTEAMSGVDLVFHLGALIAIPYSYVHPTEVVETNVMGTLNVLLAAQVHRPTRLVHTSTSEVYGTALRVPIDEQHPLQAQSPYSASKIAADKLVESFARSFQVPAVVVRPFNTYGPRQSARAVIPTVISQALLREVIQLGDLTPTRDFTYVTDTVDGFMRAALTDGVLGETFNLGNDREISVGELAALIVELVGRQVHIETDPARVRPVASEVRRLCADYSLARDRLAWQPSVSLREGLRRTIDWIRQHPELFVPERYTI